MFLCYTYNVWRLIAKQAPEYKVDLVKLEEVKEKGGIFQRVYGIDYLCQNVIKTDGIWVKENKWRLKDG